MKNLNIFVSSLLCLCGMVGCMEKDPEIPVDELFNKGLKPEDNFILTYTVNGVNFNMVVVDGGTFTMGGSLEQGIDVNSDETPLHSVTLSEYAIGETEVTQALWKAVMGSNPSEFKGDNLPVENVSWNDCQEFVQKLNQYLLISRDNIALEFRLPTEAEWEYAARGGNKSKGYKYSGSNTIEDVAWNCGNSLNTTHPVASKRPNELSIYDMTGNVGEWCHDWYGSYSSASQTNPTGLTSGTLRVCRGSCWLDPESLCRVSRRCATTPESKNCTYGFRLVLSPVDLEEPEPETENVETFSVNGVSFKMVAVEGGTFTMGATSEQGDDAYNDEKPTHRVTLSDYCIGQTEVTQALWQAVMDRNPSKFNGRNLPVEQVSWDDCQKFVQKLNQLTGRNFRLPTEAEWEYAARGGNKSKGYKYSGSITLGDVAWWVKNSDNKTHAVATKKNNELGLYDMSGNVNEWCSDWYSNYDSTAQTNPIGPSSGSLRVARGGSWFEYDRCFRVSHRNYYTPIDISSYVGLRLALEPIETYTVNGVSFRMVKVEGGTFTMGATSEQGDDAFDDEKPAHSVTLSDFSIGQTEVTQALWKAVMGSNPSNFVGDDLPVEQVSWNDCQEFVKKLNDLTGKTFRLSTEAEWEYAARGGSKSQGYKYSGSNTLGDVAWYTSNSGSKTHVVASKQPNELGLYDMSGNVCEWCQDWYGRYSGSSQTNPIGPSSGSNLVSRGGVWGSLAWGCRVSNRGSYSPDYRSNNLGLRLVLSQ